MIHARQAGQMVYLHTPRGSLKFSPNTGQLFQPLDGALSLTFDPLQQYFARRDILDKADDDPSGPDAVVWVTDLIHDLYVQRSVIS